MDKEYGIKISKKLKKYSIIFFVSSMRGFQTNLTRFSENMTNVSKKNTLQLEYGYIKYFTKYKHLYEIIFNCACAKARKSFLKNLVVTYKELVNKNMYYNIVKI